MTGREVEREFEQWAARCYVCGSRDHSHLRCPGPATIAPAEPATLAAGSVLIDWRDKR